MLLAWAPAQAGAEILRIATFDPELSRKGPGILLRDIQRGKDKQVQAVVAVIAASDADVVVLTQIDYDYEGRALAALQAALTQADSPYPHSFLARPNSGVRTGQDMDGDGRVGARDAQGFGRFPGDGGMAVLSRLPLALVADFSPTLWRDAPGGAPDAVIGPDSQRLSSVGHWHLRITTDAGQTLDLLTMAATPPVFDGPEDRNGYRNAAELAFWVDYLRASPPPGPWVLAGKLNTDPADGDGRPGVLRGFLSSGLAQDAAPKSAGGAAAADPSHRGDPALDTADWDDPPDGPGNLRADYVLPQAGLTLLDAGVFWPAPGEPGAEAAALASSHRLVWVDVKIP